MAITNGENVTTANVQFDLIVCVISLVSSGWVLLAKFFRYAWSPISA